MQVCDYKGCSQNLLGSHRSTQIIKCDCGSKFCSNNCLDMHLTLHQQSCRLSSSSRTSSSRLTGSNRKKCLNDFQPMQQTLGQGSFGWVTLVRETKTGKHFALKTIQKAELFKYCTVENLKKEIKIQRKLNHPHVIKMDSYFEDREHVYLVLEYAEGGSLFKVIKKKRKLSEDEAFVYLFQTCLGVDYLHKLKIIHRDLKPENLLLDVKGNIKICDFGWSTDMQNLRKAFCGTIEYMAPEMIKSQSHNHRLDIWCLGVLLYEMVQGRPPFQGKNDQEKCSQILSGRPLKYDADISQDCISLISMILQQNPINRPSISEIFNHKWMVTKQNNFHFRIAEYMYDSTPRQSLTQEPTKEDSAIRSPQTQNSERGTGKEWEMMRSRSLQTTIRQVPPEEQQKQCFFKQLLISLGCIHR